MTTLQRMTEDMQLRNFSPRTIEVYVYHVGKFADFFSASPEQLGPEQVRQYQLHLVNQKKASWSAFNQAVCALRFLYRHTLPRPWHVEMIPFGKKPKKLPVVLANKEVQQLLACVKSIKSRTVLATLYAAGLRLEEGLHLTINDIDSARMTLTVARGKGNKQRLVPLSPRLLETLREYWKQLQPPTWLFPGKTGERPMCSTIVQKACKQAAIQAGLKKAVTPHTLRHSYATGLMEAGVDLLTIGQLLGHRSFSSTLIYLHVRRPHLISTPSPLDWLPVEQCPHWTRPGDRPADARGGEQPESRE
jgi:site-specific recombinase XerD